MSAIPAGDQTSRRLWTAVCIVAALVLLKLWLVHGEEIIAVYNPWDQLRYAEMARDLRAGRWLGSYSQATFIRSPAYPAWVALVGALGLPLRIAVELLLGCAAAFFALVAVRAGASLFAATGAAAFVILVPDSFSINDQVLCETFYAPVMLVSVAAAALPWVCSSGRGRRIGALVWSLALAVLWHTRAERMLVLASIVFVLAIEWHWSAQGPRRSARAFFVRALPPLMAILLSTLGLRVTNLLAYGAAVEQDLLTSSFADAQAALLRIEVRERRGYVGVPESARRLAYSVSSRFASVAPFLEGAIKKQWTIDSCSQVSVCDDYANGWFLFALREAAARVGVHRDAPTAERFYAAMATEIEAACAAGTIPCRRVPLPYVDLAQLRLFPAAVAKVASRLVFAPGGGQFSSERPAAPQWVANIYDSVALRRTALPNWGTLEVSGWVYGADGAPVRSVRLEDAAGRVLTASSTLFARPDVVSAFANSLPNAPEVTGFELAARKGRPTAELPAAGYVFTLADGSTVATRLAYDAKVEAVRWATDVAREDINAPDPAHAAQRWVRQVYPWVTLGVLIAALVVLFLHLLARRSARLGGPLSALAWLGALHVTTRVLFFALVEVWLFPTPERYGYPVIGLLGATACLVLSGVPRGGMPFVSNRDGPRDVSPAPAGSGRVSREGDAWTA